MQELATAPLSFSGKARLLLICLPFPFWIAAVCFYYAFVVDFVSAATGQPIDVTSGKSLLFMALMAVVLLVTAVQASRAVRDLSLGVARVTEDRLLHVARGGRYRRAKFEKLGRVRLVRWTGSPGQLLRVVYSPATKLVWEASPASSHE